MNGFSYPSTEDERSNCSELSADALSPVCGGAQWPNAVQHYYYNQKEPFQFPTDYSLIKTDFSSPLREPIPQTASNANLFNCFTSWYANLRAMNMAADVVAPSNNTNIGNNDSLPSFPQCNTPVLVDKENIVPEKRVKLETFASPEKPAETEETRQLARRHRNNLAAKRSRENRKRREEELVARLTALEAKNAELVHQNAELKEQLRLLSQSPAAPPFRSPSFY